MKRYSFVPWWTFVFILMAGWLACEKAMAAEFEAAAWRELDGRAGLVHVPEGTRRVRVQSRTGEAAPWSVVGIVHLDGRAGTVKVRLPDGVPLDHLAVEISSSDPFPYSFYQGKNAFDPVVSTQPGGGRDFGLFGPAAVDNAGAGADAPPEAGAVQESDIWKWRGRTLYYFNTLRGLQVFDLSDFENPRRVASLRLPAVGEDMYVLDAEHVVLLANRPQYAWEPESTSMPMSEVVVVRHVGPDLTESARVPIEGAFLESRMVGATMCVVTQKVVTTPLPDGGVQYSAKQFLYAIDFTDPAKPVLRGPLDLSLDDGSWAWESTVQATSEFLFVATNSWSWAGGTRTRLSVIDLRHTDQPLAVAAQIPLAGHLRHRFQIAYADGTLTTVSEKNGAVVETWNLVHAMASAGPLPPRPLDSLLVGADESLFATRFDGARVYVVTFRQIDPLFCIDLSDPSDLRLLGELEVPGFSTYLEVFASGTRLLSLGVEDWRVAVSLFDVADPAAPTMRSRIHFGDRDHWSWSEGNYDDKAIGYFREAGLMLFPLDQWTQNHGYRRGMQLVDATADGLQARGFIDHRFSARRGRLFDQTLVSIGGYELIVVDLADRDAPRKVSSLTIAWPVQAVVPYGDSLIQLENGDMNSAGGTGVAGATRSARLRLTPKSDVDAPTVDVDLSLPGYVAGTARRGDFVYVLLRTIDGRFVPGEGDQEVYEWFNSLTTVIVDLAAADGPHVAGTAGTAMPGYSWGSGRLEAHWLADGRLLWYPADPVTNSYWWRCFMCDIGIGGGALIDGGFFGRGWFWGGHQVSDFLVVEVGDPESARVVVREPVVKSDEWIPSSRTFLTADQRLIVSWSTWTAGDVWGAEQSWVQEIDLTDSNSPQRGPVASLPGLVQGVHRATNGGVVLMGSRSEVIHNADKQSTWTNTMLVDALAYDGVHAFLLDTVRLEGMASMPTVTYGPHFLVLRHASDTATTATLHPLAWSESTGKWSALPDLGIAARWPVMHQRDGYLFLSDTYRLEALALHQLPASPARTTHILDSPVWDLSFLELELTAAAAWLPVGDYGVTRLDLETLPPAATVAGRRQRDRDTAEWRPVVLLQADVVAAASRVGGTPPMDPEVDFLFAADADAESYDAWATRYFPSPDGESALPTADPDGDGFNNFMEWAMGTDPTAAGSLPQATVAVDTADTTQPPRLVLITRLNPRAEIDAPTAADAWTQLHPQISTDLRSWRSLTDGEFDFTATPIRRMWSLRPPEGSVHVFGRLSPVHDR